jgi:hypothetical protein
MSAPGGSFKKVFYDLRPAKQIERRMLLDTFHALSEGGFRIRDYHYLGMGSIYFVDFILLHKYLGLRRFTSAEIDKSIPKRLEFNKPFDCVNVENTDIGTQVALLDRDQSHIVWLDYDSRMASFITEDTRLAGSHLPIGSFVLVTVDVEPPDDSDDPASWRAFFEREAGTYVEFGWKNEDYARSNLANVNAKIVYNALQAGMAPRSNVEFFPLWKFRYADGHDMITIGGLVGGSTERAKLNGCSFDAQPFVRRSLTDDFFDVRVPRLTRRERLLLDANMPCSKGWRPTEFEIDNDDVESYREIYRFFPMYGELLM